MKQDSGLTSIATLEAIENITSAAGWEFERIDNDEIVVIIPTDSTQYRLHFLWHDDVNMLYMACFADFDDLDTTSIELHNLIFLANQRLWLGHFDIFENNSLVFRHTMPLRGIETLSSEQIEDLIDVALGQFNLFYPAFRHMIDDGVNAREAFEGAMIDTAGEA